MAIGLLAGALAATAGACGFRPLYGKPAGRDGAAVTAELASVQIQPIRERRGQQLYNNLLDRLNPRGSAAASRYVLEITLTEIRDELAVRRDETATRANLVLTANYRLRELASNEVVFASVSRATTGFNIVLSEYATLTAQADARRRGLVLLSDEIMSRLALYFNRRRSLRKG